MADELELLRNVSQLAREIGTAFDHHLRALNLTTARARVLLFLLPVEAGSSQADVTVHLGVEHPTAVRILDGLEALGHVQRVPASDDRRAKIIVLTEQGRTLAGQVAKLLKQLNRQLIDEIPLEEASMVNRTLLGLLERTRAMRTEAPVQDTGLVVTP